MVDAATIAPELLSSPRVTVLPLDDQKYPGHLTLGIGEITFEYLKYNPRACARKEGVWPLVAIQHVGGFFNTTQRVIFKNDYIWLMANTNIATVYGEYIAKFKVWPRVEVRMPPDHVRALVGGTGPVLLFDPKEPSRIMYKHNALTSTTAKQERDRGGASPTAAKRVKAEA